MKVKEMIMDNLCINCRHELIKDYLPIKEVFEEEGTIYTAFSTTKCISYIRCPACGNIYAAREESMNDNTRD